MIVRLAVLLLAAQERDAATTDVFRRYSDHVVKIEVAEQSSGAKAELGSAFFVTSRGHLVTNYHVIAKLIHDPDRYRAELVDASGARDSVAVLAVDFVHDLAPLASPRRAPHFSLGPTRLAQGRRLYALGHPRDLGLAIVEGTYNGRLQHTLYERIHFTGSLNPGMSGGELLHGFLAELHRAPNPEVKGYVDSICNRWNVHYRKQRG